MSNKAAMMEALKNFAPSPDLSAPSPSVPSKGSPAPQDGLMGDMSPDMAEPDPDEPDESHDAAVVGLLEDQYPALFKKLSAQADAMKSNPTDDGMGE